MAQLFHSSSQRMSSLSAGRDTARAVRREALSWPEDMLTLFSLRMASHGMSISRVEMFSDSCYALQQLSHARDLGDPTLALMANEMFRLYESQQSGLYGQAH